METGASFSSNDKALVESLQRGDVRAFDQLFGNYAKRLYAFGFKYLRSKEDAEGLVQDVFLKIWENRKKLDKDSSFKSYLFTIAYNDICSIFRKRVTKREFHNEFAERLIGYVSQTDESVDYKSVLEEVDRLIKKDVKKDEAIFKILKNLIIESKPIRFNGDGYSHEWLTEAAKRGLTNVNSVPEALTAYKRPETIRIFSKLGVLNELELNARVEVEYEKFIMKVQIESRVLGDIAINHIVPTAIQYQTALLENVNNIKKVFPKDEFEQLAGARMELIKEIGGHISFIKAKCKEMIEARKRANVIEGIIEKAELYDKTVKPFLEEIRYHIDKLELTVDNELWPLPKYRELLFVR